MSRFFVGGSSSEEESEEERSGGEEEEEQVQKPAARPSKGVDALSSDEELEPKKRVVKSTRDKRFEELTDTVKRIKNAMKINDWNTIHADFDKLNKQYQKSKFSDSKRRNSKVLYQNSCYVRRFCENYSRTKDNSYNETNKC